MIYFAVLVYVVVCNLHLKCGSKCEGGRKTKQCITVELLGEHCPLVVRQGTDLCYIYTFLQYVAPSVCLAAKSWFLLCAYVHIRVYMHCIWYYMNKLMSSKAMRLLPGDREDGTNISASHRKQMSFLRYVCEL